MQLSNIPLFGLILFLNLPLLSAYPVYNGLLTNDDMNVLKVLLHRLEESIPERSEVERVATEKLDDMTLEAIAMVAEDESEQQQNQLDKSAIREFLSARDLKTVRNDSTSKRYSGCFGRRLDRIGSMSSLGCNTVGKYNPKRR
ncbi:brain natriuretic peptide isoform X2 [Salmo salar]|uniref:Brain natriuretic peptide isoform X2 n=1 Tax=Salmo salar TaxID=8030 RepID=A0A1S3MEV5_SALSA|nr:brain natriuretic peptide isoform X2 [Salmo salar]|eukprot:XP_014001466.1 PREDICTED: brain natriuretic peptide-like isoform X2 [Salmo salar]